MESKETFIKLNVRIILSINNVRISKELCTKQE